MKRETVVGCTAAAVATLAATALLLLQRGGADTLAQAPRDGARPVTIANVDPTTTAAPTTAPPTAAATTAATSSPLPDLTAPRSALRPGERATADPARPAGYPLPTGCLSYGHACAYPDARGATPGGVFHLTVAVVGPRSVRAAWRPDPWVDNPHTSKPTEYVVSLGHRRPGAPYEQVFHDASRIERVRLPYSQESYTFDGLVPGDDYVLWVQELNSSGLSQGGSLDVRIKPPPSPTPKPTPSATPTPAPSATPTATASATATPTG